jgi:hypothetical protein
METKSVIAGFLMAIYVIAYINAAIGDSTDKARSVGILFGGLTITMIFLILL